MPIRASEKARYPKDWRAISARIRERDGNQCKHCQVPNGTSVLRLRVDESQWCIPRNGEEESSEWLSIWRGPIRIVLTVAHLDHQPENCADENLAALCQRYHLRYDSAHHRKNAAVTRRSRKAARELFQ